MQIEMDVLGGFRFSEADIFRGAGKLENIVREGCLMPNPDFTGNVPHRRCETCKWWFRYSQFDNDIPMTSVSSRWRYCREPSLLAEHGDAMASTDLSVCSNWSGKEE